LGAEAEIKSALETIRENIKISAKEILGYYELKHQPWSDEGCTKILEQRKQAKLLWLQNPSEINWDNLYDVICEASRYFRKKKRE
jgi:hypothetical protein